MDYEHTKTKSLCGPNSNSNPNPDKYLGCGQGTHSTKMGADSLAENTPNASINFSPICLSKPKPFEFLKKSSRWMSVVRAYDFHWGYSNESK